MLVRLGLRHARVDEGRAKVAVGHRIERRHARDELRADEPTGSPCVRLPAPLLRPYLYSVPFHNQ